jgi:hypothetical protein
MMIEMPPEEDPEKREEPLIPIPAEDVKIVGTIPAELKSEIMQVGVQKGYPIYGFWKYWLRDAIAHYLNLLKSYSIGESALLAFQDVMKRYEGKPAELVSAFATLSEDTLRLIEDVAHQALRLRKQKELADARRRLRR